MQRVRAAIAVKLTTGLWLFVAAHAWAAKPNVIIFLADDAGIGDTSAYLGKKLEASAAPINATVRTPNLERLAASGMVFTDAHSPSSMCSTSRYALLTGRYAQRSIVKTTTLFSGWTGPVMVDEQRQTLGTLFQRAGYNTSMFGKWHLGMNMYDTNGNRYIGPANGPTEVDYNNIRWPTVENPNVDTLFDGPSQHGFDYSFSATAHDDPVRGIVRGFFENKRMVGIPQWQPGSGPNGGPLVAAPDWESERIGEKMANRALGLIDAHAGVNQPPSDKPFFMYYASMSPHYVYSPATSINLQGTVHPIRHQSSRTDNIPGTGAHEDMVYENDVIIGAMLDKLQTTIDPQTGGPMIDNTIVIFASDNGSGSSFPLLSPGMRDFKQSIYEGGHRVSMVASWPGHVPAGSVADQELGFNDLYATFAAINGVQLGQNEAEDSENMLPVFLGQSPAQFQRPTGLMVHDDSLSNDIPDGAVMAIRQGNMKLIVTRDLVNFPAQSPATAGQAIPLGLYDLGADLHEDNNLLNDPQYATLVSQLTTQAHRYFNQGFSRSTIQTTHGPLLQTDGGADLANNLSGSLGYEFTVGASPVMITRLGMWDDAAGDVINQETNALNPDGDTLGMPDGLSTAHWVRLFDKSSGLAIASVEVTTANSVVEGEFRYVTLEQSLSLTPGADYALTMSTTSADGDLFHTPAPSTGTSPIPTGSLLDFQSRRSLTDGAYPTLLPTGTIASGVATESVYDYRFFVGPTGTIIAELPAHQAADFNNDGQVDGADLVIWQTGIGSLNATRANGDADGNGLVNGYDLAVWNEAFAAGPGGASAVPEPGSLTSAFISLTALYGARRIGKTRKHMSRAKSP